MILVWRRFSVRGREADNEAVIAGSPHEPMTRSIASDLERRGYIVFITVTSTEEESAVHAEGRPDVRPLFLDLTAVCQPHSKLPIDFY